MFDDLLLAGARRAFERHGFHDATLARIAAEADVSRMTLHRRGVDRVALLRALAERLEDEHRAAMFAPLTAPGSGRERLEAALVVECELCERDLDLLRALSDSEHAAMYHQPEDVEAGAGAAIRPRATYVDALRRLLLDGAADGSLRAVEDPEATATVLTTSVGRTYRHLRDGHRWTPERARDATLALVLDGLAARP